MCRAIFTEQLNAQVKGSGKLLVTVVATQELEAGDVLRRFGAETAQDESLRGNNNNRCIVLRVVVVGVWKFSLPKEFFSLVCCVFFSSFFIGARVCVMVICTAFLVMFSILDKVTGLACC